MVDGEVTRLEQVKYLQGATGHGVASTAFLVVAGGLLAVGAWGAAVVTVVVAFGVALNGASIFAWDRLRACFESLLAERRTEPERTLGPPRIPVEMQVEMLAGLLMLVGLVGLLGTLFQLFVLLDARLALYVTTVGLGVANLGALALAVRRDDRSAVAPGRFVRRTPGATPYLSFAVTAGRMETSYVTLKGDAASEFASTFVERKAEEISRSINKRGARNVHRYRGDGVTHVTYERAASRTNDWLLVSMLIEPVDPETCNLVVTVGGGGEGPFKFEEVSVRQLVSDEESFGESGRFLSVLEQVRDVCESLGLAVDTTWQSEIESDTMTVVERKLFD